MDVHEKKVDVCIAHMNTDRFGVKRAVDEFAAKHEQKLYTTAEMYSPSWYIIKQ
jgi:hypothetical protein